MKKRILSFLSLQIFLIPFLFPLTSGANPDIYVVDRFSGETEERGVPKGWKSLDFKKIPRSTHYSVVQEGENFVVKAHSESSASGILKELNLNPGDYPVLSWRWKVENVLQGGDASKKSGDDYPARIYVAFLYNPKEASFWEKTKYGTAKLVYGKYPPKGVLNYVWDNKLPKGSTVDNAYTDRAKMVILQSGTEKVGKWVQEERNILEDYEKLFGGKAPQISFIAIMSDTDNTGEAATAYYDDIILKRN